MTTKADATTDPATRRARGRELRSAVPRSVHGTWRPGEDRRDPVAWLEEKAATRVPELVPVRHGRMIVSPFTFFRGAALIMAADLAATPQSGLRVQLCGDAHLSNFGVFGTPERKLIFDINDFDETLPGPWEWDVKRLAASFEVAARDRGFAPTDRVEVVRTAVRAYRETMREAAGMGVLQAWYAHLDIDALLAWIADEVERKRARAEVQRRASKHAAKALTRDSVRVATRLANEADGHLRFSADPPLLVPISDLLPDGLKRDDVEKWMNELIATYRRSLAAEGHPLEEYRWVDTARKVVGVGSVGTRAWVFLFTGRDDSDPLVLQAKEAQASVLEPFVGRSRFSNHGKRVVTGQRLMQAASDLFLGWLRLEGLDGHTRDYYVRQLHDWKGGADVDRLEVDGARLYAQACGSTLARAHARRGDRIAIASYLGKGDGFDRAVTAFARVYADQNERDYAAFAAAVASGRLEAETGR